MPTYDHVARRWALGSKPPGYCWSSFVLGRLTSCRTIAETGTILVSAYKTRAGALRYTDPITSNHKPGRGVLYRIRVTLNSNQTLETCNE